MNRIHAKRILRLATFIEKLKPEQFDIHTYYEHRPDCGTICCIAGWAGEIKPFQKAGLLTVRQNRGMGMIYSERVAKFLGLDENTRQRLFYGGEQWGAEGAPTTTQAAKVLRGLVKKQYPEMVVGMATSNFKR